MGLLITDAWVARATITNYTTGPRSRFKMALELCGLWVKREFTLAASLHVEVTGGYIVCTPRNQSLILHAEKTIR